MPKSLSGVKNKKNRLFVCLPSIRIQDAEKPIVMTYGVMVETFEPWRTNIQGYTGKLFISTRTFYHRNFILSTHFAGYFGNSPFFTIPPYFFCLFHTKRRKPACRRKTQGQTGFFSAESPSGSSAELLPAPRHDWDDYRCQSLHGQHRLPAFSGSCAQAPHSDSRPAHKYRGG